MALHLVRSLCFASLAATLIPQGCAKPPPASDRGSSLPTAARVAAASIPSRPTAQISQTPSIDLATASAPGEQFQGEEIPAWLDEHFHSADPNVRIQALDAWARQPTVSLDPVTYALVDPDESVRARRTGGGRSVSRYSRRDGGTIKRSHFAHRVRRDDELDETFGVRGHRACHFTQVAEQQTDEENTMKHRLLHAFGFVAAALLALVASPAAADTVGPYYAPPSWDQQLPASTRFVVLSNWVDSNFPSGGAAVLDRETGLVWERSPSATLFAWEIAQFHCNQLGVGNRLGWRLPTLQELTSLVDPTVAFPGPTLPAGHPFTNVQSTNLQFDYWSATTVAFATDSAWQV